MKSLSEMTLMPLGTAIAIIGGGAGWMTKIYMGQEAYAARIDQQATKIEKVEQKMDAQNEYFSEIRERLIRIEMTIKKEK